MDLNSRTALKAGDIVRLSGVIYTARDAAHKRLTALIDEGKQLPIDINNAVIYYAGPCPARPGQIFGSCGPTTSGRMDIYSPALFDLGQQASIGKGNLGENVKESMVKNKAVYFVATGGAGALISRCIKSAQVVAFEDLGAEAIYRLEVENLPLIVGFDCAGVDLYEVGAEEFATGQI